MSRLGIGVMILITPSPRFREGPPLLGESRSPAGPGWSLTNELSMSCVMYSIPLVHLLDLSVCKTCRA